MDWTGRSKGMASSPRPKRECFDFEEPDGRALDAMEMGSASASYSRPTGGSFAVLSSPLDYSSPPDGRKRRKNRPSWVKHTFTPHFDGHLWRKYGQKSIKDSAFPRLYYRCSYREDKQCLASKLVQQENNDDQPLFKVTYTYEHTCNTVPVPTPDVVAELPPPAGDALLIRFDSAGSSSGDAHRIDRERQGRHQYQPTAAPPSGWPFLMLSFDSNSQAQAQPAPVLPSELPPAASSSFYGEALPEPPPSTANGGDMLSTWDSLRYGLDNDHHAHFGDHVYLPDVGHGGDDN